MSLCHTIGVTWTELRIDVPRLHGDAVANFLIDCGAPGLQCADDGDTARLTAYFANQPPLAALRRYCADLGCPADRPGGVGIDARVIADEDWAHNWKLHSQPQLVGERLYISPSWAAGAPAGRIPVIIDPGMAFGTGQHPSTRGCLRQIERVAVDCPPRRALDVGTGSGVLAIALAKLGTHNVWAVDTDATACTVATANAIANDVAKQLHVRSDLSNVSDTFDLVVANLYANGLASLAPRLSSYLRTNGTLITAGLLLVDEVWVQAAYEQLGFAVVERDVEESWVTLVFRRTARL
jgi:ribosomal protein L11 methyltransferase